MVTAEATARKYAGRMAKIYEAKRQKQLRWKLENEIVGRLVSQYCVHGHKSVLDVPVGTGRFLHLWKALNLHCTGYDTSEEMLALAKRKRQPGALAQADIRKLPHKEKSFDLSVCVRFLDLVPQDTMQAAMHELARVTKHHIILTIRLGERYIAKVNTATHDGRRFAMLCKRLGFETLEEVPIFQQGWRVILLERKTNGRSTA
jgi:ubiquinone/menaquinone biosynthesis C-methylase UbiE